MAAADWIQPLYEAGTAATHTAFRLAVTTATGLSAKFRTGHRGGAKRTAGKPVQLKTKPRHSGPTNRKLCHNAQTVKVVWLTTYWKLRGFPL